MNTDADLGHCCVGYQSSLVAFARSDVKGNVLVRLVGQAPRGCQGYLGALAQKAKLGYCPYCTTVTRVALPLLRWVLVTL